MRRLLLAAVLSAAPLWIASAADWPQWLGPNRNGLTDETGLLKEWPDGGPKRLWLQTDTGLGYSGPAVVGKQLLNLGAFDGTEKLQSFDVNTGERQWQVDIDEALRNGWGDGPRGTPTVDGDRVYALAGRGVLVCCELRSGKELWRVDLKDLGGKIPEWGYSESPLVDGKNVLVTPGGDQGAIACLDKLTGEVKWRSEGVNDGAHYSSIIAVKAKGQAQYVQLLVSRVVGISPQDGTKLWQSDWPGSVAVIPTALYHDNHVYVTSGYGAGCKLVDLGADGKSPTTVYESKDMKNHHGQVVLVGDHIYGHSDGAGWMCQNFLTGKVVWRERTDLDKGAVAYADGMLYCLGEDSGDVVLIEASPEGWAEHGRFTLDPQTTKRSPRGRRWTHPVIVGGKLLLRDQDIMYCYDISAK